MIELLKCKSLTGITYPFTDVQICNQTIIPLISRINVTGLQPVTLKKHHVFYFVICKVRIPFLNSPLQFICGNKLYLIDLASVYLKITRPILLSEDIPVICFEVLRQTVYGENREMELSH